MDPPEGAGVTERVDRANTGLEPELQRQHLHVHKGLQSVTA